VLVEGRALERLGHAYLLIRFVFQEYWDSNNTQMRGKNPVKAILFGDIAVIENGDWNT
jgi:hypothetical protein